jgi:hypothetical protein
MSFKTKNELVYSKEGLEKVLQVVMKCLVEGALSIKLTEEEHDNTLVLFTLPNGVSTASANYIVEEWLEPEVLNFVEKHGEFSPYTIIKHFVSEIDKIQVEVI